MPVQLCSKIANWSQDEDTEAIANKGDVVARGGHEDTDRGGEKAVAQEVGKGFEFSSYSKKVSWEFYKENTQNIRTFLAQCSQQPSERERVLVIQGAKWKLETGQLRVDRRSNVQNVRQERDEEKKADEARFDDGGHVDTREAELNEAATTSMAKEEGSKVEQAKSKIEEGQVVNPNAELDETSKPPTTSAEVRNAIEAEIDKIRYRAPPEEMKIEVENKHIESEINDMAQSKKPNEDHEDERTEGNTEVKAVEKEKLMERDHTGASGEYEDMSYELNARYWLVYRSGLTNDFVVMFTGGEGSTYDALNHPASPIKHLRDKSREATLQGFFPGIQMVSELHRKYPTYHVCIRNLPSLRIQITISGYSLGALYALVAMDKFKDEEWMLECVTFNCTLFFIPSELHPIFTNRSLNHRKSTNWLIQEDPLGVGVTLFSWKHGLPYGRSYILPPRNRINLIANHSLVNFLAGF